MALHKLATLDDYHLILTKDNKEVDELYNDFLINVTKFFRDAEFFAALEKDIIPNIIEGRKSAGSIRIWVAGCATGEEAYSVAITLTEYLERKKLEIPYQIFASDLDANAIGKARLGIYPVSAVHEISSDRLKKYFKKMDGHYQVEKYIREACIFSQQNLLNDPPFSRMDLISCQNVLIYLENDAQQKVLQTFHYALKPSGYLFLGKSESIGNASELFESLDKKMRLYSRRHGSGHIAEMTSNVEALAVKQASPVIGRPAHDLERDIKRTILTNYVMPCVVLNSQLNIVQFFGATSHYLAPVVGKASFNILKMIREDLLIDLRTLIQLAKKNNKPAYKEGIIIHTKKERQQLTLEVAPIRTEGDPFFLVVFRESIPVAKAKGTTRKKQKIAEWPNGDIITKLEEELILSRELIRTTNEEYESTYEELQTNNEQILSSNEELQSVNEEMETSKEELQSANEELTTINEELQKRNLELKESQNYANAIVDTVNNPFLVLTANLQVRVANKSFYETFKLTPESTEGSFIYELGEHSWDINVLRDNLNDLLGRKTNYREFKLEHFFPKLGDMAFIVNAYRLIREDNTKETLVLLAFNNIGELIKSNHTLKSVNEQLEQFIFVSGHDLQEPLRKIQTFSNYLIDYEKADDYVQQYLKKINGTASRMSVLLRDLLSYSALLQNRSKKLVKTDLNKVLEDVLVDLEPVVKDKEATIHVSPLPVIVADTAQMEMLFSSLLSNALKFNRGKPVVHVSVSDTKSSAQYETFNLDKSRTYVCIDVSDNGVGFNMKYIAKMFSLFQRLHDKKGLDGTGMGLPIAKKIVEDHGGRIFAEGKENEGSKFSVFLPKV